MNQYLAAAKRRQANGEPLDDNDKSLLGLLHADPLHDCVEVSAEELGALQRQAKPTNGAARRPTIQITTDIHDNVDEAAKLLARDPEVYQRDGQLVRVVRIAESEADTTQHAGTPVVRPIVAATLRERLTLAADWVKLDKRTKKWLPTVPTDPIVGALAARGAWDRVRPIVGITEAPLFRPNGTILETPGYDANTGYLYVPSGGFPKVPAKPTQVDARRALADLAEVFVDFPYSDTGRVVPIAAILTLLARPALGAANVPAFVFDANVRGSGKGLQANAVCIVATGRPAAKATYPVGGNPEELEKILGAFALRGASVIVFDNVTGTFGGGPLEKVLTSDGRVTLRVLGQSHQPELHWRATILATGNNLEIIGDATRRVLVGRIDSPEENPERRQNFAHHPLLPWVDANRPRLVVAALTMLRAWALAGRPRCDVRTWGSFEEWAAMVPPAIVWAGGADVMGCRVDEDEDDTSKRALITILNDWPRLTGPEGMTAKAAVDALYPVARLRGEALPDSYDDLREAIGLLVPTLAGKAPNYVRLGYVLRGFRGRVVGGKRLKSEGQKRGASLWSVVEVQR